MMHPEDAIAVLPDIDAQTIADIQPPCECTLVPTNVPCPDAADWIVHARCTECSHSPHVLLCTSHQCAAVRYLNAEPSYHVACGRSSRLYVEAVEAL